MKVLVAGAAGNAERDERRGSRGRLRDHAPVPVREGPRRQALNSRPELVVYVENAGDFIVPLDTVAAVHAQKVILNCDRLDSRFREAIDHAHDAETRY